MDDTDIAILGVLTKNARTTASQIGGEVNLSVPAAAARIRRLEQSGVIKQYTIKLDRNKTGKKLLAFLLMSVSSETIDSFRQEAALNPHVLECHHIAGEYDYLLKVAATDTQELENFLSSLKKRGGIVRSNTIITLTTIKE